VRHLEGEPRERVEYDLCDGHRGDADGTDTGAENHHDGTDRREAG
jgi:hypothetical protein